MIRVFHHNDPDGVLSAAVVNIAVAADTGEEKKFYECDYSLEFPWGEIDPNDTVYMVDYSLPPSDMVKLSLMCNFIWIDHHTSAIKAWEEEIVKFEIKDIEGLRAVGRAGCQLTMDYFKLQPQKGGLFPCLIDLIGSFDVWDKKNPVIPWEWAEYATYSFLANDWTPTSTELVQHLNLSLLPFGKEESKIAESFIRRILSDGKVIYKYLENYQNKSVQEETFDFQWEGLNWLCVNTPLKGSGQIVQKFDLQKYDGMICYHFNGKVYSYGLYTEHLEPKKDFSELARKNAFGEGNSGGGHKGAARFASTKNIFSNK